MKIVDKIKNIIHKIKKKSQLLLDPPGNLYSDLINSPKIQNIINKMPENLSEMEKAYYIYLELGKFLSESPTFVFSNIAGKKTHYNDTIDDEYYGICKSFSELYVSILADKRIGISADSVKRYPQSLIPHVDTILRIDGKNYICNLISDLSRIKTSRRVNSFCFDLDRPVNDMIEEQDNIYYLSRLESYYGKIDSLSREDIEKLDKKLGYSFFVPQVSKTNERGLYTEDIIDLLRKDMNNPELFKEYVLHGKDVPENEILKYKLDYIFNTAPKLIDNRNQINYLENIRYYFYIASNLLSREEGLRIKPYVVVEGDDLTKIISIIKVIPPKKSKNRNDKNEKNNNFYYLYSTNDKKYEGKTPKEMKEFMDSIDKDSLHIVGLNDGFDPRKFDELEI